MNPPSDLPPPPPAPDGSDLEDTAIAWLAERDDGFSPPRAREFARWLRADPRHAATVARLEQTLGVLGELPDYRAEINTAFGRTATVVPFAPVPAAPAPSRAVRRGAWWLGAVAAAVLAIGVWVRSPAPAAPVRYVTTVAGFERARLDDGSTLELNAASAVRVQFSPEQRRVQLETGEAHFAVAHDTARPFVVVAGEVAVRAVGTAFNVRLAPGGEVEVTVVEGRVRVGQGGPESAESDAAPLVGAGERIRIPLRAPAPVVEKVPPDVLRAALAWQGRLAEFAEAPLADVVARFNARSRVQLVVADPALAGRRIGGTFALDEAEAFVRLLERDGEIVGERRGPTEIHLRRAR